MKSEGKEKKENGREKELRGEELTKRIHMENLCSIWDLFNGSWSWQSFVSSYYVLTVFLHWIYKTTYSCYQDSFVILGWIVYWVFGWEMRRLTKSKRYPEIIVLRNKLLMIVLRLTGCVRGLKSLQRCWPYLMAFKSCISTGKLELL